MEHDVGTRQLGCITSCGRAPLWLDLRRTQATLRVTHSLRDAAPIASHHVAARFVVGTDGRYVHQVPGRRPRLLHNHATTRCSHCACKDMRPTSAAYRHTACSPYNKTCCVRMLTLHLHELFTTELHLHGDGANCLGTTVYACVACHTFNATLRFHAARDNARARKPALLSATIWRVHAPHTRSNVIGNRRGSSTAVCRITSVDACALLRIGACQSSVRSTSAAERSAMLMWAGCAVCLRLWLDTLLRSRIWLRCVCFPSTLLSTLSNGRLHTHATLYCEKHSRCPTNHSMMIVPLLPLLPQRLPLIRATRTPIQFAHCSTRVMRFRRRTRMHRRNLRIPQVINAQHRRCRLTRIITRVQLWALCARGTVTCTMRNDAHKHICCRRATIDGEWNAGVSMTNQLLSLTGAACCSRACCSSGVSGSLAPIAA